MQKLDIRKWVDADPGQAAFRQAVHTILMAISSIPELQTAMVMKGGVLLALHYQSPRYTGDIDFSTPTLLRDFDSVFFREKLEEGLVFAVEGLDYGLDCRVQTLEQSPPREDASFPTIKITVGYAYKDDTRNHKRLSAGNAIKIVKLDYSLNEPVEGIDLFELEEGNVIHTYNLTELVAEKFRALLQQHERKRIRGQDLYDLYYVLIAPPFINLPGMKGDILRRLLEKSSARGLAVDRESMAKPEIIQRSKEGYSELSSVVEGELLSFDDIYASVQAFFRSLPWS